MVILNILRFDGAECSETYMEGDKSDTDALFAQGVKEFGGEMQSCGRCGGAAALAGIDGLISVVIFELLGYIMRQRHLAYLIEQFKEHSVICEFCKAVAVRQDVNNLGEEHIMEGEPMTLASLFAWTRDNLPDVVALVVEKKELDHRTRVYPCAVKARGKHLCVVENKAVSGLNILRDITKNIVLDGASFFVEHHESRTVARLGGMLCNEFLRQVVKEIAFFHYFSSAFVS